MSEGNDGGDSGWDPEPVKTTIEFRGQQVRRVFVFVVEF